MLGISFLSLLLLCYTLTLAVTYVGYTAHIDHHESRLSTHTFLLLLVVEFYHCHVIGLVGKVDFTVRHLSSSTAAFPNNFGFSSDEPCIGNGALQVIGILYIYIYVLAARVFVLQISAVGVS